MPRVVFTPSGLDGDVEPGTTVLEAARSLGVDLDSVCGGRGICGRCQIDAGPGTFPKWGLTVDADALSAPGPDETTDYRGKRPLVDGRRLGCSARIEGDLVVDVPPDSQIHRQVVRKEHDDWARVIGDLRIDPVVELRYLEPADAVLGEDATVVDRLVSALADEWGIPGARVAPHVLSALHPALAASTDGVTVAVRTAIDDGIVRQPPTVVAIWPGLVDLALGVAVDVGSTTVAGHLVDLATGAILASAGRMNPQIRFGEDLMSRVSYVMMNPGGDVELTEAVRRAIAAMIGELIAEASLAHPLGVVDHDRVLSIVLVGNPVMHHLLLGIDPTPLGAAPFLLATDAAVSVPAGDLELDCPNATAWVAPCIAGHVGGDTAAVINAEGPHRSDTVQLVVDVGTNAEIVLGDRHRLFAASSPTGPAFEGAQITSGVRATAGAVERVRIDRDTLEPSFKVIGSDLWSDDSAFYAVRSTLDIVGICGSGIIEVIGEMFLAGVVDPDGTIRGELADPDHPRHSPRIVPDGRTFAYLVTEAEPGCSEIRITQNDVRAIQLAKAALRAGIDLLMDHAGLFHVDDIRLAGAFGSHIDPFYALVLGLVPDCPLEGIRSSGNAAGSGAVRMLLSTAERADTERVVRTVTKVETATEPRFQELFVDAMAFPHRSAPSPHLAGLTDLPTRAASAGPTRRRRRSTRSPGSERSEP